MTEANRRDEIQGAILHECDGIEEADNHLPLWWLATFFGAIAFGAVYWSVYSSYELLKGPLDELHEEQAAAAQAAGVPLTDEQLAALASDPVHVAAGRAVFAQNCVVCHGDHAQGNIGPNLTDRFWLHGGAPTDILHTIRMGFAPKNMPQWGTVLGPVRTQDVAAFVLSLRDTNAADGKAAQGLPYDPADAVAAPTPTSTPVPTVAR